MVNLYVEQGQDRPSRRPRPGLTLRYTLGAGPVRASLYSEGAVGPAVFSISGSKAYSGQTEIGTMTGTTNATIASSGDQVVFTLGGEAYLWTGSVFSLIADVDLPAVSGVRFLGGRFYYQILDSDQWFYSALYDAAVIDGLAFATAESSPDWTRGIATLGDEVWFFGSQTIEPWYQTGDADAPLQRAQGRRFERGCAAAATICGLDNTLFWLGENGQVYRAGATPLRVSTNPIEKRIREAGATTCTAFSTTFDGHEFYVLNIPGKGSFAFDVATSQWAEWQSYGQTVFKVTTCSQAGIDAYLGSTDGKVYGWDFNSYTDNGDVITRICPAFLLLAGGALANSNVCLQGVRGVGTVSGQGLAPLVEMRWSDNGHTWSNWAARSLGEIGEYGRKAVWWRLGQIRSPGRWYEFRTTDPVIFSPSGLTLNEPVP
jgi:hypothetical protein